MIQDILDENLEEFIKVRNQFVKEKDVPPEGIYEAEFLAMIPGPSKWSDKSCAFFYFLMRHNGKEYCPGFLARPTYNPRSLAYPLFTVLTGKSSPTRIEDITKFRGKMVKIKVVRAEAKKLGRFYPKVVHVEELEKKRVGSNERK